MADLPNLVESVEKKTDDYFLLADVQQLLRLASSSSRSHCLVVSSHMAVVVPSFVLFRGSVNPLSASSARSPSHPMLVTHSTHHQRGHVLTVGHGQRVTVGSQM